MTHQSNSVSLQLPWARRQWRKISAQIEDHPVAALLIAVVVLGALLFYGTRLRGWHHARESWNQFRLDNFGGVQEVERSVEVVKALMAFGDSSYDRLDAMTLTTAHLGATAFRQEFRQIIGRPGGRVRVLTLDPRLADKDHPHHQRFVEFGKAEGHASWEFAALTWHCCAVLLHMAQELGPTLEVRLVAAPSPDASPPYFSIGRSVHAWTEANANARFDIIVPEPHNPVAFGTLTAPALIIRDRPQHPEAQRFERAFAVLWEAAVPLDAALQSDLLQQLNAPRPQRSQP